MKRNFAVLGMIALAALVAGCKKDNNPTSLPVTIEQYNGGDKVYVNSSNYACWNDGDKAQVNGVEATIFSTGTGNASIALGTGTPGSPYHAVYPASRVTGYSAGTYSVTLPDTQHYRVVDGNQIVNGIMAAYGTTHLAFKNLTALVKVTFTNGTSNPITVGSVRVSTTVSGQYLSGSGTVTVASSGSHTLSLTGGSQSVSLIGINQNVAASASATFYVVVPAFASKAIKVEVLTENGAYTKSSPSATLEGNDMGLLSVTTASTLDATKGVTNGHEWVQLWSGGPKWATCNVGATEPQGYGDYFAWGETQPYYATLLFNGTTFNGTWKSGKTSGYAKASNRYYSSSTSAYTKYTTTDKTVLETSPIDDDAAHFNWGGDWRMPAQADFNNLLSTTYCTWTWKSATDAPYYCAGYLVTGSTTGYTDNSIFLPAAGYFNGTSRRSAGAYGDYWSSTRSSNATYAYYLDFLSSYKYLGSNYRYYGCTVRPVR